MLEKKIILITNILLQFELTNNEFHNRIFRMKNWLKSQFHKNVFTERRKKVNKLLIGYPLQIYSNSNKKCLLSFLKT